MGCSGSKNKGVRAVVPPEPTADAVDRTVGTPPSAPQPRAASNAPPTREPEQIRENSSLPKNIKSPSNRSMETPTRQAASPSGADAIGTDAGSTTATAKVQRNNTSDISDGDGGDGSVTVVLPKGVWVKTEGTPYYYSASENLYYHPPSCQFYDPTNEMWYDPEKDEWYHDDNSDSDAA
ncbi:hypothetical protein CUR178_01861 [Leishmania enriettii]|uniref:OCRE domain-containing protein n=1 Tax=Leishmania enriettii TaxID=5663 RepID=A0A836FUS4_LEIEN|nr:hypothetical protein CUR178_01861 [Leishmania enriettii]